MTVSFLNGNSHFSFLSVFILHFSFLIFNVFLICYFDLICINEKGGK